MKKQLLNDCATRGNSTLFMLERLFEQRLAVPIVLTDETVIKVAARKSLLLKSNVWDLIEQLLPVLRPLAKATTIMCAEQHVGLSFIYPVIINLLDSNLKPTDSDMRATQAFKAEVSKQLTKQFKLDQQGLAGTLPIMACLLDSRFKHLQFLQNDVRKAAKHHLSELVLNLNQSRSCGSAAATVATATFRPCGGDASESAATDLEP
ncbi:Zinc finger BED domain-containing protein 1 [Acipenser ruthenus]|uniref:Zinc finger BED domain-containing protein 1 n=1 Tax=Acipenser ruthenus TaxID=7906 RepID=A0A444U3C5_ACIRT|nr:Zinc finger BED domain-containing protein 1 [Acipenser ruthenus]